MRTVPKSNIISHHKPRRLCHCRRSRNNLCIRLALSLPSPLPPRAPPSPLRSYRKKTKGHVATALPLAPLPTRSVRAITMSTPSQQRQRPLQHYFPPHLAIALTQRRVSSSYYPSLTLPLHSAQQLRWRDVACRRRASSPTPCHSVPTNNPPLTE